MHAASTTPQTLTGIDVVIIGAGPSGSIAASLLHQQGKRVVVIEKQHFRVGGIGSCDFQVFLHAIGQGICPIVRHRVKIEELKKDVEAMRKAVQSGLKSDG